ncbi:hypothetical protein GW17_00019505, partial [Ensete ventricosum]
SEQRIVASKVIKRFILHAKKTAFVVEHDFIMATYLADKVIVYEGKPSLDCIANAPQSLVSGMNLFLSVSSSCNADSLTLEMIIVFPNMNFRVGQNRLFGLTKECNFDLYHPVWVVRTGPPGYRYTNNSLPGGTAKIDRQRSISAVGCRLREKSTVGGRLREKKKEEEEKKKKEEEAEKNKEVYLLSSRRPCPRAVVALARR